MCPTLPTFTATDEIQNESLENQTDQKTSELNCPYCEDQVDDIKSHLNSGFNKTSHSNLDD